MPKNIIIAILRYCCSEVLFFFFLFSRPTLGGLLTSSYRQHQESLNAERERRRLEREERLQRIEREERNRFKFVNFLSIHFDAVCVFTQGYIISWIWQIHQHFQRHLVYLILEMAMRNIVSSSLEKQLRATSKFVSDIWEFSWLFLLWSFKWKLHLDQTINSHGGIQEDKCLFSLYVCLPYTIFFSQPLLLCNIKLKLEWLLLD